MRRSTVWFAIAAFWFADGLVVLARHRTGLAGLTVLISVAFLLVGLSYRRRERRTR